MIGRPTLTLDEELAIFIRYPQTMIIDGGEAAREASEDIEDALSCFENPLTDTLATFFECDDIDGFGIEFLDCAMQTLEHDKLDLINNGGDEKLLELEVSALVNHQYAFVEALVDECQLIGLFNNPTRTNYYEFNRILSPGVLVLTKRKFSAMIENRS